MSAQAPPRIASEALVPRLLAAVAAAASPRRARRYALLMLVLTAGGGALNLALGDGRLDRSGNVVGADFLAFYTGARFALTDRLPEVYGLGVQRAFQQELMGPAFEGLHPFINPPHAALLYLPFGLPPYPLGLALWWGCGLALLALSARILCRELPRLAGFGPGRVAAGAFLFFPTVAWWFYAQATPWIALLYTLFLVQLRRGHDLRAGLCLGALAFKPQLALVLALVLVAKARWRAVVAGAGAATLSLGAGWALSPEASLRYLEIAPRLGALLRYSVSEYPTWGVHSLYGFWVLLLDGVSPPLASALSLVTAAAVLAALLWAWRSVPWEPGSRSWDLRLAASFALGLVISPHLFVYDLALLLVPFALVLEHHPGRAGRLLDGGPLLAWTALLWLACFLGSYLSKGQMRVAESLGAAPVALQLSTVAVLAWSRAVWRSAGASARAVWRSAEASSVGSPDQRPGS